MRRSTIVAIVLLLTAGRSDALAWGCDGHRAIAMLAERLLGPATLNRVRAVLAASPVDPALKRTICRDVPDDAIADQATWADDQRAADPSTAAWHFINFPLIVGANTADHRPYCRAGDCAVDAIAAQFRLLRTSPDATVRANALRFILHFVGDLHQPLHSTTNGDRGGNCVPVTYFSQAPVEDERGNYVPNLNRVWDVSLVQTLMTAQGLPDARALAAFLARPPFPRAVTASEPTQARVRTWARGANALARTVTYGRLPVQPAPEPATALTLSSCDDNNYIAARMASLDIRLGAPYEQASRPIVVGQMRLAGQRLAATLKAAFPEP